MSGIAVLASTMSSLKSAYDLSKALIGVRDAAVINERVIELQRIILSAQSDAMTAQSDQFTLLERVRDLEKQIAEMKAWEAEKQRYELKRICSSAFAYMLKPDAGGTEPQHWLCTTCYEDGKKSILNGIGQHGRDKIWNCPRCGAKSSIPWSLSPEQSV